MNEFLADESVALAALKKYWRPPPKLSLSQWADENFYLSAESSAEAGKWKTIPYQRGIMDAITDPRITYVYVMKSARVGYTKCLDAAIGFHIDHDPCSMLVVQPTVDGAKTFSKEEIAPMLRDCPNLAKIVFEDAEAAGPKDTGNTILHKRFPGGVLSMVGANSGAGFRSISRRVVIFDEVDAYPPSAGSDGDQIKLGIKRSEYFWNRKIIAGSTPLVAGASRIEALFESGDQRRYFVPCPQCGHMAPLVFSGDAGHSMHWPKDKPEDAHFICQASGCIIEHKDKRLMVERGEWRSSKPFEGIASFHVWAAYSYSPNASWAQIASEFIAANKGGPEQLKTFINTVLGETWKDRGDAPDWERLFSRREQYQIGRVPEGVQFLTAGVDVQKDRVVYEIVGWGFGKESWSVDAGVVMFDTSNEEAWLRVDELLNRQYPRPDGSFFSIAMLAVDSGYNTNTVYNWARRHPFSRVIAIKGSDSQRTLIGSPSPVDVNVRGKKLSRGYKIFTVGSSVGKSEFYGWLKLPHSETIPPGFCHFPEYGEDYFKQITAEQLVTVKTPQGYIKLEWQLLPARENHFLDARIYARAAAMLLGLDRMVQPAARAPAPPTQAQQPPQQPRRQIPDSNFLGRRGRNWLGR